MRLLILGGTPEGRALARELNAQPGMTVTSSLAGGLSQPVLPPGDVRIGGFRGAAGLVDYLRSQRVDVVIDATHPFASTITGHAARAVREVGCRLIVLHRPGWTQRKGDRWSRVADSAAAAAAVAGRPAGLIFLTTGRRDTSAFAADAGHEYLIRLVERGEGLLPPRSRVIVARGPFRYRDELAIMRENGVSLLVTKDAGGKMTAPKLAAARDLGVPVLLIDRPAPPGGVLVVGSVDEALRMLPNHPPAIEGP